MAISKPVIIAFYDLLGTAITPTANFTAVSGFPLSNLCTSRLAERTRTPDLTADRQLTWDMGTAVSFNVVALMGNNAALGATRQWEFADNSGFSTNLVQSGGALAAAYDTSLATLISTVPVGGRPLIYIHPTTLSKRYIRYHQSDGANADGYMEWGIFGIGVGFQPSNNYETSSWRSADKIVGAPGAEKILRGHEITIHVATRTEASQVASLMRGMLSTRRVLLIPEPTNPEMWVMDAIWCVLEKVYERSTRSDTNPLDRRFSITLAFREAEE